MALTKVCVLGKALRSLILVVREGVASKSRFWDKYYLLFIKPKVLLQLLKYTKQMLKIADCATLLRQGLHILHAMDWCGELQVGLLARAPGLLVQCESLCIHAVI